ncbi:GIY-YIG nuclease family protein [uncultured Brachyspira sp.]|uniref:GIY-YIG nuclease family protein n=1 Tax=uncultured Brachyspira sp. TaxID=221953 RepID=UPI002587E5CE|nr:GIY-YIG nuclease family protein [uncultured Brachyspira sp.]
MKLEEFEKIKDEYIKNRKRVKGDLNRADIKKADFNGVYLVLNENDEVVYIGSAYTNRFTIKNRLNIHLNGDESNATIVNYLIKTEGISRKDAKKKILEYKFVAYEYDSIEYKLIENVDGLYNSKGRK